MRSKLLILIIYLLPSCKVFAQDAFFIQLADSAVKLTEQHVQYDPSYYTIAYPNGDIPSHRGVCTDVVIRAYRKLGIDLQREVHEDMTTNFNVYPNHWGLLRPDKNIDHRRVPNLMTFFERQGITLPITDNPNDYKPGDIVCWNLGGGITHIGIVSTMRNELNTRALIIHNIGNGQVLEDMMFNFEIIGHYRYQK